MASYPKYFDVTYSINPWMDTSVKVEQSNAIKEWENLVSNLETHGAEIVRAEMPDPNLPDFVFTANAGMVIGNKAAVSSFRDKERQPETPHFAKWFEEQGYETLVLPEDIVWEGEACTFPIADKVLCSYGLRSDKAAYDHLLDFWEIPESKVVFAEIIDPYFYHLDVAFCPISKDTAMYCSMAFTGETIEWLKSSVKNLIPIPYDDALNFACNAVVVNDHVFMNTGVSQDVVEQIEATGYKVVNLPINEFIKAGGGIKCLLLYLDRWHQV